jgi:putative FmdB family regulatory protein
MPIYEFACGKCRRIYSFLSKRVNPAHKPTCPKCGNRRLIREVSQFATLKGVPDPGISSASSGLDEFPPGFDEARMEQVMGDLERDMEHMDENNPRHMAHMLKKMQEAMPPGSIPKELNVAIKRLEAGEDPEKIEADMGDILGSLGGDDEGGASGRSGSGSYAKDPELYDY